MANLATIQNSVLTTEQIDVLTGAGLIPKNTPPAQVSVYAKICADKGLNPFTKEIYLVKTTSEKYGDTYTPMVGIDGWRRKIHEMGDYVGTETKFNLTGKGEWKTMFEVECEVIKWYGKEIPQRFDRTKVEIGKNVHQILMSGVYPLTCTVEVYRSLNGVKTAFSKTVSYREFAGTNKWESMPLQMIEKVGKAFSYKEALGEWASGLHIEEEKAAFEDSQAAMIITEPVAKTDFTAEEKKVFQARINAAATSRELALTELGKIIDEYQENGFDSSAFVNHYTALIDKRFPPQAQIEAAHELEIVPPVVAEVVPYKPTTEVFAAFGACKTIDALNDMIDNILTDLTITNQDTAPFLEYAQKLRTAFEMKSK